MNVFQMDLFPRRGSPMVCSIRIALVCLEGGVWVVPSFLTLGSPRIIGLGKHQRKLVHIAWNELFTITCHCFAVFHYKVFWSSM